MSIRLRHHLDVIKNIHTKKEIRSFVSGIYWVWYSRPYCIFLLGDATVGALCSPPPVSSGRITAGQLSCCLGAIQKPSSAQLETGFITYICLVRYLFGPCPLSQSRQSPQCAQLIMLKAFESKTRFHNNPQEPRVYLYSSHTETPPFHVVVGFLWSKHVKTTQNRLGQGGSRWSPTLTHIHTHTHTQKKNTFLYVLFLAVFSPAPPGTRLPPPSSAETAPPGAQHRAEPPRGRRRSGRRRSAARPWAIPFSQLLIRTVFRFGFFD